MITFTHKGDFEKTFRFLRRNKKLKYTDLDQFGQEGVDALRDATPVDTGLTANSWGYRVVVNETTDTVSIEWFNTNVVNGVPIAIILQYDHATGTGGYVEGYDYINPAIQPIFDRIAANVWREITK